jgi:prepilin-type N-terminal cleavage/methylation domain-containing protein
MDKGLLMMDERSSILHPPSSIVTHPCHGHTLVEVITVVLVLSILACVAVPRLDFGAVWGARADAIVERLATDLRRTRADAIAHAARNPDGFVLVMSGADPCHRYQILDQHNHAVIVTCDIPPGVLCGGGRRFEFGPLGNLQNGSDTHLRIGTGGKTYLLEIVPATGAVTWSRIDNGVTKDH